MHLRVNGFTLVEIMVAVTVTTLLLFTIYGVFSSVSTAKERLETDGEGYHQARVLFDRMGREIRGAYFSPSNPKTLFAGGVNEEGNPFLAVSTTATTPHGGKRGGISIVRYELCEDPQSGDGQLVLMRSESSLFDADAQQKPEYRLATGIQEMKLRFYGNGLWQEQWSTGQHNSLPQMVELSVSVTVDGATTPFLSAFDISSIQAK
jgi:general secretion pathway protein J